MTFLCTRIPQRALEAAKAAGVQVREYHQRGWPTFERCESELIKPSHHCLDLNKLLPTLEEFATQRDIMLRAHDPRAVEVRARTIRIGEGCVHEKSLHELAQQGSYINSSLPGVLGDLVKFNRRPPMPPIGLELPKIFKVSASFRKF